MGLKLNDVLRLTQEEIGNSKIEFIMQAESVGQPFLDRWLKHSERMALCSQVTVQEISLF